MTKVSKRRNIKSHFTFSEEEYKVLIQLSIDKDMSKNSVIRQALRLYQRVAIAAQDGERIFFANDTMKKEVIILS